MIPRDQYLSQLLAFKDTDLIKIITGIRRCGKSSLLKLFEEHLRNEQIADDHIIRINFEYMEYDDVRDYKTFYRLIKERLPKTGKTYILLDEIQQVEHWEKAVLSLSLEADTDIYITGSNAYLLSSEIATLISGRYVEIKMLPLSFKEYLLFNHLPEGWTKEEKFNQYLKFGGFPLVPSLPQETGAVNEYLTGIYHSVVIKDILTRNKIRDTDLLERIIKYVITNTGNFISPSSISGYLSSQGKGEKINHVTISSYLNALEKAYIVYSVPRFDIRGKEQLKKLAKYYAADSGLFHLIGGYTGSNVGHVLETVVYLELIRRGYTVSVGKWADMEVDFVAVNQQERLYVQVAWTVMGDGVLNRELKPLQEIGDNHTKILLSLDKTYPVSEDGIILKNVIDFLLE